MARGAGRASGSAREAEPPADCACCPRLVAFRAENQAAAPDWYNGAVTSFGAAQTARVLIVGLAPGLRGANRTGRPFTGDYAGDLLYGTLIKMGFAEGAYGQRADDGLTLKGVLITNAVRCVPPANKPTAAEITTCRKYLTARIASLGQLRVIIALGRIAHDSTLSALGLRRAAFPFGHALAHDIGGGVTLIDSYHCSRYNTNTGRLTAEMFEAVFAEAAARLGQAPSGNSG